jgi:hypothetical protein
MTTIYASKDNFISKNVPTDNQGASEVIDLYGPESAGERYCLMAYDKTGLGAVSTAILSLYCSAIFGDCSIVVQRVLYTDWTEGAGGDPAVSNWNQYKAGTNWNTAGCKGDGTDYTTTNAVTTAISGTGWKTWELKNLWNAVTGLASLDLIIRVTAGSFNVDFHSRHYVADPSLRPKLAYTLAPARPQIIIF